MFRFQALPPHPFADLFALSDDELGARHARRVIADRFPGFPCRVSLEDAQPGETLILAHHLHHDVDSPYRASGPIFIREHTAMASPPPDTVPVMFRHRLLSVRGYSEHGHAMRGMEVVAGDSLEAAIEHLFSDASVAYLHLHNARPGCYVAHVQRH